MARLHEPLRHRLPDRSAAPRGGGAPAPARCPGASAQLAAVHRTLCHGPALQLQPGGAAADAGPAAAPKAQGANRTGLPDRLKAGVEALSGISLDGVKVHYNSSKPAQLDAHAYARGSDIHLGPGQERHLPHEAWHVVQQAQGRVKPTLQMKDDLSINDDAGLEHEADVMGTRALGGTASAGVDAASPPPRVALPPGPHSEEAPVQRKVGFEFETGNTFKWKEGNEWKKQGRTKGDPMYRGENFVIEGDTKSTPEVILKEADTWATIDTAINKSIDVLESINEAALEGEKRIMPAGNGWEKATAFEKDIDTNWEADIQVTHGVSMAALPQYLEEHLSPEQAKAREKRLEKVTKTENANVDGFVDLVIQFVADMQAWEGKDNEEGPKNAQAFMARNPYSKMLGSMSAEDQKAFATLFLDGDKKWKDDNPVTLATEVAAGDRVIKNAYRNAKNEVVEDKTTLKDWISGMIANVNKSDLLSPPTGWKGGGVGGYGMGLMDVDKESVQGTPLLLLEYRQTDNRTERGLTSGKHVTMYEWATFAEEQFELGVNYDPTLTPRQKDQEEAGD